MVPDGHTSDETHCDTRVSRPKGSSDQGLSVETPPIMWLAISRPSRPAAGSTKRRSKNVFDKTTAVALTSAPSLRGLSVRLLVALVGVVWVLPAAARAQDLTLTSAVFTTHVEDNAPAQLVSHFDLRGTSQLLWFHSVIECDAACGQRLDPEGVELSHTWSVLVGPDWLPLDRITARLKPGPNQQPIRFRFPSFKARSNLSPTRYRVEVRALGETLCLRDDACDFQIDVR